MVCRTQALRLRGLVCRPPALPGDAKPLRSHAATAVPLSASGSSISTSEPYCSAPLSAPKRYFSDGMYAGPTLSRLSAPTGGGEVESRKSGGSWNTTEGMRWNNETDPTMVARASGSGKAIVVHHFTPYMRPAEACKGQRRNFCSQSTQSAHNSRTLITHARMFSGGPADRSKGGSPLAAGVRCFSFLTETRPAGRSIRAPPSPPCTSKRPRLELWPPPTGPARRGFSSSAAGLIESRTLAGGDEATREKNRQRADESHDEAVAADRDGQAQRRPWHREGSDLPPVKRDRSAGAMTKGKLLTTPSRLLKLIIPLTTVDINSDRKDAQPLALLVHPQQPLSYLERLVQAEIPTIKDEKGNEKIPSVTFRAQDSGESDSLKPKPKKEKKSSSKDGKEASKQDGKETSSKDGKEASDKGIDTADKSKPQTTSPSPSPSSSTSSSSSSSSPAAESPSSQFVRWSSSTEIGDFIRDAARGREFAVDIEGNAAGPVLVAVPSFADRTFYLRQRLRRAARALSAMAGTKRTCDLAAHRSAQRVALAGFFAMAGWWLVIYYLTFRTDYGWDTMEPVTYLVGLSGLMAGYLWFLYHNREVSYRAAMNLTVSRRQSQLYAKKGFDLERWEELIREGNELRREIKAVAREYDVEWNESEDEQDERVMEALKEKRDEERKRKREKEKDDN